MQCFTTAISALAEAAPTLDDPLPDPS
jgi:hypothetical protein